MQKGNENKIETTFPTLVPHLKGLCTIIQGSVINSSPFSGEPQNVIHLGNIDSLLARGLVINFLLTFLQWSAFSFCYVYIVQNFYPYFTDLLISSDLEYYNILLN